MFLYWVQSQGALVLENENISAVSRDAVSRYDSVNPNTVGKGHKLRMPGGLHG